MKKQIVFLSFVFCTSFLHAQDMSTHQTKGEVLMNNGDMAGALTEFNEAIKFDTTQTGNGLLYSYAGICAQQTGDNDLAKNLFQNAINRGFADEKVFEFLSVICINDKDYQCQEESYLKAIELFPDLELKYKSKLCNTYYYSKDYEKLLPLAEEVLSKEPSDTKLRQFYAIALQRMKKNTEALAAFEKLLEYEPDNLNANIFLGNYYYQVGKGQIDKATKEYEKIQNPSRMEWTANNKKTDAIVEKYYTKAIPYLEKAYSQNPDENLKKMLFAIYSKKNDKVNAEKYK